MVGLRVWVGVKDLEGEFGMHGDGGTWNPESEQGKPKGVSFGGR